MELICPSCEARYQLPEGAIPPKGRQVSCMNCGHSWHARPPMELGEPVRGGQAVAPAAPSPQTAQQADGAAVPGSAVGGAPAVPGAAAQQPAAPAAAQSRSEQSRTRQMAEIRQMLADVQSTEGAAEPTTGAAPGAGVDAAQASAAAASAAAVEAERARAREAEEREHAERAARKAEQDEMRTREDERAFQRRIEQEKQRRKPKQTDVKRLHRKHTKKVKRQKHDSKAGSGAFLTGFLLIVIIAATMVAMYRLAPQIVARMPNAEEPMREYVATMDRLRAGASETLAGVQKWIQRKTGEEEG